VTVTRSVLVVGGGIAGLVAARHLALGGDRVTLLEAGDHIGGALRSASLDHVSIDVGAEAFAVTRTETLSLIEDLGLSAQVVSPRRSDAHLLLSSGVFAMPHAMLGVPTDLSAPGVLDILGPEAAAAARALDHQAVGSINPAITLGALVRERMGDAVAEQILTPVVAGVHAADPDLVECEAVIPGLVRAMTETGSLAAAAARLRSHSGVPGAAIAGLRNGMTTLVSALERDVARLGVTVRRSSPVQQVRREAAGWTATVGETTVATDDLVLAVDAPTAARMLAGTAGPGAALGRIAVGDVAVVAMVLAAPELDDDPVGSGLLVAPGHPFVTAKALTHVSAKWEWVREAYGPGRHLVRLSYGRDGAVRENIDDLPEIARADVTAIFGLDTPEVLDVVVTRWDRSLVFPQLGHRQAVAEVRETAAATPGLAVVGAGIGGNGLAGTIALARSVAEQLER
jgi:oxygen-dependent protoporphyrinogen oxidase